MDTRGGRPCVCRVVRNALNPSIMPFGPRTRQTQGLPLREYHGDSKVPLRARNRRLVNRPDGNMFMLAIDHGFC